MFRKVFLPILFLTLWSASAGADETADARDNFARGNACYEKGDFAGAVEEYEKITASGFESPAVYFNLGNAYFRLGNNGKAMLNYARAYRLDPDDPDLVANYKFLRANIASPITPSRGVLDWPVLKWYFRKFTVDGFLIIFSLYCSLALLILAFAVHRGYRLFNFLFAAVLLFLAAFANLAIVWYKASESGIRAIVTGQSVECCYGPFDSATVFFKLQEGTLVKILQERDSWVKVRRVDGKSGWVKAESVEII